MITLRNILLEQSNNPKAIILAGSPGAGKSSIIEGIKNFKETWEFVSRDPERRPRKQKRNDDESSNHR